MRLEELKEALRAHLRVAVETTTTTSGESTYHHLRVALLWEDALEGPVELDVVETLLAID